MRSYIKKQLPLIFLLDSNTLHSETDHVSLRWHHTSLFFQTKNSLPLNLIIFHSTLVSDAPKVRFIYNRDLSPEFSKSCSCLYLLSHTNYLCMQYNTIYDNDYQLNVLLVLHICIRRCFLSSDHRLRRGWSEFRVAGNTPELLASIAADRNNSRVIIRPLTHGWPRVCKWRDAIVFFMTGGAL